MKILHYSDWHGEFLTIDEEYDIVVCSGDMMPNFNRANIEANEAGQHSWVISKREQFEKLIGDRKYLFSSGNHCFIDPTVLLRKFGLDAICIDERKVIVEGTSFFGFPWIPIIAGEWRFEVTKGDMASHLPKIEAAKPDVLVAHAPPYGYCDSLNQENQFSNSQLTSMLMYGDWEPRMILCGHLHTSRGTMKLGANCLVSNAATTYRILEI